MAGRRISKTVWMVAVAIGAGLVVAGSALCASSEGTKQGPPQFAIDACKGHKEGDSVQTTNPKGETVSGTCQTIDGTLVFVPPGFKGPRGGGADTGSR